MKIAKIAALGAFVPLLFAGCGGKIQSDLELQNARFSVSEAGKAQFTGTVKNTGDRTYKAVTIVVDGYENDQNVVQISTTADLFSGRRLEPGATTSFSKNFEDGGSKPDRYEVVRLYGIE